MVPFRKILVDGKPTVPRVGDRLEFHVKRRMLCAFRDGGALRFVPTDSDLDVAEVLLDDDCLTERGARGLAEVYARLGGLLGEVKGIESAPGVHTFEVLR